MLNILVPTDFSELSKVAVHYALDMAKQFKGKVTLLYVIDTGQYAGSIRLRLHSLLDELQKMAELDFNKFKEEVNAYNKTNIPIKYRIEQGNSFVDTVKKFAKRNRFKLIVMGTHGASGLKKVFMGSNTASLLEASEVPVLAVPAKAEFKSLKSVVYATDLKNLQPELKSLISLLSGANPLIHIIHITTDRINANVKEEKIDKAIDKSGYRKALVRILFNNDPIPVINEYVKKIKIDMLTMFPHQHTFFEKLFKRSVTKELSFYNNVPLLAFKGRK